MGIFLRVVRPDLAPDLAGEREHGRRLGRDFEADVATASAASSSRLGDSGSVAVKASSSSRACARWAASFGNFASSASMTRSKWARTWAGSDWAKTVRSRVSTQGWADFGTRVARFGA